MLRVSQRDCAVCAGVSKSITWSITWVQSLQRSGMQRFLVGVLSGVALFLQAGAGNAQDSSAIQQPPASSTAPSAPASQTAPQQPTSSATQHSGTSGSPLPTITVRGQHTHTTRRTVTAPPPAPAPAPPPETAFSHVQGYVATRSATATKTDTPLVETPQSVSVVTRDQWEAQGAQNLPQAVQYSAGVFSEMTGADDRFENIYIRGFLADQYLDGMKLLPGVFAVPQIPIYDLERIEILHGPASVLYGQASPGGLVDMVSKRPTLDPFNEVIFEAGSYHWLETAFDSSGPIDKDGHFLYRITGLLRDTDTQVDFTQYDRYAVAPAFTWRPNLDTTLTILTSFQHDPKAGFFNELPAAGTALPNPHGMIPTSFYGGEPDFDKYDRKQDAVGYLFEHTISDTWTVRQNFRYMDTNVDFASVYPTGFAADMMTLNRSAFTALEDVRTLTVDNQAEAKFGTGPLSHTLLLGVDYQNALDNAVEGSGAAPSINAYAPVYGQPITPPPIVTDSHQTLNQLGLYTQDQIKLGGWVALLSGREDLTNEENKNLLTSGTTSQLADAFTKRAALLYHFDNGVAPYIQYTESFQPTIGTAFGGAPFKPTTGQQEEVGIKYQPPGSKTLATVAVFDLTEKNVLTPDPNNIGFDIQTGAIGSKGVELEDKTTLAEGLSLTAAYTYLDLKVLSATNGTVGLRPVGIPEDQASLWGDYTFQWGPAAGFGLGAGVRYLGPSAGNTTNTFFIPGATLFDTGVHYDFSYKWPELKGLYVAVNATNVLDDVYVQWCQNQGCYYGLRRSIIGQVRYRF